MDKSKHESHRAAQPQGKTPQISLTRGPPETHGYDRIFWLTYLSNGLTTFANGMLVRYSDYVDVLGGDEQQLGLIVGVGMLGSILIRLAQGEAIDRYGAAKIWFWSVMFYAVSLLLHLAVFSAYSPAMFLVRALMQASLAGILVHPLRSFHSAFPQTDGGNCGCPWDVRISRIDGWTFDQRLARQWQR